MDPGTGYFHPVALLMNGSQVHRFALVIQIQATYRMAITTITFAPAVDCFLSPFNMRRSSPRTS